MKKYSEKISELIEKIPDTIIDLRTERDRSNPPTQASSNFITNKEQGDWAEDLIFRAINDSSKNYVAVRYGKSDDIVAGDEGFETFYNEFQNELDCIGKRPDLLVFSKDDYNEEYGLDISKENPSTITEYIKKAVAGLEIRSSSFLINKYDSEMHDRTTYHQDNVYRIRDEILGKYEDLLVSPKRNQYIEVLNGINAETIHAINFRRPSWKSNSRLQELTKLFKELKDSLSVIQKRDYLSITPKIEDLKVVYKWVKTYNVPHYYIQVFFDKSFGISFKDILTLLTETEKEGEYYEISGDIKNQNKITVKINTKKTVKIANKIDEPEHSSIRKEIRRGRLLFYVTFKNGTAYLDIENLKSLLGIEDL